MPRAAELKRYASSGVFMKIEEKIFVVQLKNDFFADAEVDFTKGLAQRAVDHGYDSLSDKQKLILEPYLSICCSGVTDPGGNHNHCEVLLQKEALLEACQWSNDGESLMCEKCRDEQSLYEHQWQKISDE